MLIFRGLERFVAEDLYPYRWPITVVLLVALAAAAAFVYRKGWHMAAWRHQLATGIVLVALLAAAILTEGFFLSPLWNRLSQEENPPAVITTDDTIASGEPAPDAGQSLTPDATGREAELDDEFFIPRVTYEGEFAGADDFYFGRGKALLIETGPGVHTMRFEDFSVRNGPDLFVFLSPSASGNAQGSLDLGRLKATDGAFDYEVPPGTDVSRFKSVIVWSKLSGVLFAIAPLSPAP